MRACSTCGKADQCVVDFEKTCNPKLCPPDADERWETHHEECPKLMHEVRLLYRSAKLVHTPANPGGELERRFRADGWTLMKNGTDMFRKKMLCRACIQAVYQAEERHKDYVKACKRAQGRDDRTYSELLAQQSAL